MKNGRYYYDFKVQGKNLGYFEMYIDSDEIYQNVRFQNGKDVFENPFYLKISSGNIVAFKKGQSEWSDLLKYGENHFPSSACFLLLAKLKDRIEYFQINEANGEIEGLTALERNGDIIYESRGTKKLRSFKMQSDIPIEIDWGGAISSIKKNLDEAIAGSPFSKKQV